MNCPVCGMPTDTQAQIIAHNNAQFVSALTEESSDG